MGTRSSEQSVRGWMGGGQGTFDVDDHDDHSPCLWTQSQRQSIPFTGPNYVNRQIMQGHSLTHIRQNGVTNNSVAVRLLPLLESHSLNPVSPSATIRMATTRIMATPGRTQRAKRVLDHFALASQPPRAIVMLCRVCVKYDHSGPYQTPVTLTQAGLFN